MRISNHIKEEPTKHLGHRIKAIRVALGLSISYVCTELNIYERDLMDIEIGNNRNLDDINFLLDFYERF